MAEHEAARLEIKYCVSWGYFWKAASLAAELAEGHTKEVAIVLTPVHDGRFEVYLDGEKVYDRKEAGQADFYPSLRALRQVQPLLARRVEAATAKARA